MIGWYKVWCKLTVGLNRKPKVRCLFSVASYSVKKLLASLFGLVFLVLPLAAFAAAKVPVVLKDFPDARLVYSSHQPVTDYVLALGNYKKVGGLWRVDEQRLAGELFRRTYQLPDNHTPLDGFQFVLSQLQHYPLRELYSCRGRECGDSNSWAINHFNILQLYGLDQHQYYGAYELASSELAGVYATVYSVLRGNKRVYLHVEILVSDKTSRYQAATSPATMVRQLKAQGYTVFAGLRGADGYTQTTKAAVSLASTHVAALATALSSEPYIKVALVGHNYERLPLDEQRKLSLGYALSLKRALVGEGIAENRITVEGLGGLSPAGRGDDIARVDVVLLPIESAP